MSGTGTAEIADAQIEENAQMNNVEFVVIALVGLFVVVTVGCHSLLAKASVSSQTHDFML